MPLFVCEKCGVIENTALSTYWSRNLLKPEKWDEEIRPYHGKALCSECVRYEPIGNGNLRAVPGEWHGQFPKQYPDEKELRRMRKNKEIVN